MTIEDILRKHFPEELAEFAHSPWDYTVIGPRDLSEEASFTVYLHVGQTKRRISLSFTVQITEATVTQTHIKCPKFTS